VNEQFGRSRLVPLLLAVVAMALLWFMPDIETESVDAGLQPREAWRAVVVDPAPPPPDPDDEFSGYGEIVVEIAEGPRVGEAVRAFVALQTTEAVPADFEPGAEVVITISEDFDGSELVTVNEPYRLPLLGILVLVFAAVMILVGGWQGLRALVALGLTILLVAKLFIPLILDGWAPVPLAIALASLVTVATVLLTEGLTRVSAVAIAGTLGGLAITAVIATLFSGAADFTPTAVGELVYVVFPSGQRLDGGGVLLAAIILGAVGVLDDVTVTQAATVEEFAARTAASARTLWRRATRVGRSHIAATTNTLFMAYVGASLPALIFIIVVAEPTLLTLNREILALEVVRTLVGSIGIILAMPLTTLLAAVVFGRRATAGVERPS
jgi:uncharacterized membrane protein